MIPGEGAWFVKITGLGWHGLWRGPTDIAIF